MGFSPKSTPVTESYDHIFIDETLLLLKEIVLDLYDKYLDKKYVYHCQQHAIDVAIAARIIGGACHLSDKEMFIVQIAAWVHDLGYIKSWQHHEMESVLLALPILSTLGLDNYIIHQSIACVLATKMPQSPSNELQAVVCDADLYQLSTEQYFSKAILLREEMEMTHNFIQDDLTFIKNEIAFLSNHHYHTSFGKETLEIRKHENIAKLKNL